MILAAVQGGMLMKNKVCGLAAALALVATSTPAAAQGGSMWDSAPATRVRQQIEAECRGMNLQALIVPDFLFGVDGDGDGRGDDFLMSAAVAQCVDRVEEPTVEREVMCRADACRQWLVLHTPSGYRLAWTGFSPSLSGMNNLRIVTPACESNGFECRQVYWRQGRFVDASTRRPIRR
jgi:hypothetical protein